MKLELSKDKDYNSWIREIKARLYRLQIKAALSVNKEMLAFYWDLGKEIIEKQEIKNWGDAVVEQLSSHLSTIDTFFNLYLLVKIVSSLKLILNSLPILQRICSTAV